MRDVRLAALRRVRLAGVGLSLGRLRLRLRLCGGLPRRRGLAGTLRLGEPVTPLLGGRVGRSRVGGGGRAGLRESVTGGLPGPVGRARSGVPRLRESVPGLRAGRLWRLRLRLRGGGRLSSGLPRRRELTGTLRLLSRSGRSGRLRESVTALLSRRVGGNGSDGSTCGRAGLRETADGLARLVGCLRRGAPRLGESVTGLLTGCLGRGGVDGACGRAGLREPVTGGLSKGVGRTLRRNVRRLRSGAVARLREPVAALSLSLRLRLRLSGAVLWSRRRGTRLRESVTTLGGRRRGRAPGLREAGVALRCRCRTRAAALRTRCRTRRRTELREALSLRLPRSRTSPGTTRSRRRRSGVGGRSGRRLRIRTLTRHGRRTRTSRPSRRRGLRCLRLERLLALRRHRRLRRAPCLSVVAPAVVLRRCGPLRRRSRRGRLIRGRQRRKPTLRQRRRSPRRRRVLHGTAGPRTKPRHYVLRRGVLGPRILRFRVRRLIPARLSVLRLGIVARPDILGLRVLGLQVPRGNSVVDLVVRVLGILTGTLGNDINTGETDNVRGLFRNVAFALRLVGPLGHTFRGRPRVAPLNLFLFVYALDATVIRPTPERHHLSDIRVVHNVRAGANDILDFVRAIGTIRGIRAIGTIRGTGVGGAAPLLKPSALLNRIDGVTAGRLLANRRLLDSLRTVVAALPALGLRSPLLNLPLKSDSGEPHRGATLQVPVLRVLLLVRSLGNGCRRHRRNPRSLETAPYRQVGQSGRTTGVSGRRRSLSRTRLLRDRGNGISGISRRSGRSRRRGGNRRRRRLLRTTRRILRIPGRRRVIDGELARRLDGGLRVGLVIAGCGPAPADPVPIAVHNSSWCGRAPSCRTGATVLVVRGRLIRPALPL